MTKIVKNVIMVFTLVVAIFLVVFCVELILVNEGRNDNAEEIVAADNEPEDNNGNDSANDPAADSENGGEEAEENGQNAEIILSPPPPGTVRHELLMPEDELMLSLYVDEQLFDLWEGEFDWEFVYSQGGTASLEIAFYTVDPAEGFAALAERFLVPYLDGGDSTALGETAIGSSPLRGQGVTGESESLTYEAWLVSLSVRFALVFVIKYENQQQRAALYDIIDTFEMHSTVEEPEEDIAD